MQLSGALVTGPEPAQVVQPRERALDNPALFPKPRAVFCAPAGDHGLDLPFAQLPTVLIEVIATVGEESLSTPARPSTLACNRGDTIDKPQQLGDVVAVSAGQADRERNPVRVGDQVVL